MIYYSCGDVFSIFMNCRTHMERVEDNLNTANTELAEQKEISKQLREKLEELGCDVEDVHVECL